MQVHWPVVDLCREPGGARDRQLLFGETIRLLETSDDWAYVQATKDDYRGYLNQAALRDEKPATHWVSAASTHLYTAPDFKSRERLRLSHGSRLTVTRRDGKFSQTLDGFVPRMHIAAAGFVEKDPVHVAERFLGTPYLWGGNSIWGIDCSGLVQAALTACNIACPGDSAQQIELGQTAPQGAFERNDLLFWRGHVALIIDAETLIHANAASMSTCYEGIETAIARIADQGDGAPLAHKRVAGDWRR
ncbi:MAG: NlpC/P60 family protein [Pseudomonadota bacterium]